MPPSASTTRKASRRLLLGTIAVAVLAGIIAFGSPFSGRASATTIPMVFPLERRVTVLHDYLAPRVGHLHQGTDLMAAKMTKELAVVSGTVTLRVTTYNGQPNYSLWLAGDDGHGYFYIHINNDTPGTDDGAGGLQNAFAPGLVSGAHVEQGQHIAYVGDSGNAENTGPHLHFEIHETTSMSSPSMDPYDSLVNAPLVGESTPPPPPPAPAPGTTRYEQNNSKILYLGKWTSFATSGASGGSYTYASAPAKAIIWFSGTNLDLIATTGTTQGKAQVSVDGESKGTIDFSSSSTLRQRKVWSTGSLPSGTHKVVLSWTGDPGVAGGTRINVDAVVVTGTLSQAALTNVEQADERLVYRGTWTATSATAASGGSYRVTKITGSSVTINFTGSYLVWLAKQSPAFGIAKVTVDGGTPILVDLYKATTAYKQKVWNTGVLASGAHTVVIQWTGTKRAAATNTNISIDAVQVLGTVN